MLSVNAFNLDMAKLLLSGEGLRIVRNANPCYNEASCFGRQLTKANLTLVITLWLKFM